MDPLAPGALLPGSHVTKWARGKAAELNLSSLLPLLIAVTQPLIHSQEERKAMLPRYAAVA